MLNSERLSGYINSLYKGNTVFLDRLEKESREKNIPIIRKDTQALLRFLIEAENPGKILEIGAATGFSAILMAEYSSAECRISTIENYKKRIPVARENIERSGFSEKISLMEGDATDILPALQEGYDMVFIDAAKAQYPFYFSEADRLLNTGGFIVADNCLQDGDILESRYAVERRNRTIHKRMREFLKTVTSSEKYSAVVLPIGDGVAVAHKKYEEQKT